MKRMWAVVKQALATLGIILALCLCWTLSFYMTEAIYVKMAWQPHPLARMLTNASAGFVLFGVGMMIIGLLVRKKQNRFFHEMIDALNRIAKGDFRVKLDFSFNKRGGGNHPQHPVVKLVSSINDMAVNLKVMEEMRQEFISNVSHEIGSPLTSIRGFAKALRNDTLEPEQREHYLDIIETETVRLSKLSDNLLKLAILDSENHTLHLETYRLDKQLRSIILASEPQWEEKKLDISLETEEVEVRADKDLMNQVWVNVIHNAIKFTPSGGMIGVCLEQGKERVIVRVVNSGEGIGEQDLPHIFDRFYKADKSRHRTDGGSGLGLSIAKKIIELHQGAISARSIRDVETEFIVELPLL